MKKIVIGMIAVALTFSATAQKNEDSKKDRREQKEARHAIFKGGENFDKLNLTDAQKQQVKSLNENFRQQMKEIHKQGSITADQQKEKRQALAKEHREKIAAILTPEQREQFSKNAKENWKDGKFRGSKDGGREDRFGAIWKDLNLTPEQSTKMESINAAFRTNLQNLKQNASLSHDEKKEQMKKLMKQHRSDLEALLTNDQKEQLKNRQKNRPSRAAVK